METRPVSWVWPCAFAADADLILARILGRDGTFADLRKPLPDDGLSLCSVVVVTYNPQDGTGTTTIIADPFPVANIPTALQHLERAAAQKIPEALFLLGHFYLSGGRVKMCHYMGEKPYPPERCDKARPFFEAAVAGDRKLIPAGYLKIYKHFLDRCNGKW